jgi:hypothetical protein
MCVCVCVCVRVCVSSSCTHDLSLLCPLLPSPPLPPRKVGDVDARPGERHVSSRGQRHLAALGVERGLEHRPLRGRVHMAPGRPSRIRLVGGQGVAVGGGGVLNGSLCGRGPREGRLRRGEVERRAMGSGRLDGKGLLLTVPAEWRGEKGGEWGGKVEMRSIRPLSRRTTALPVRTASRRRACAAAP